MVHSILIGIDFSDTSVETVRWAVSRFPRADLTLCHAIEPLNVPGYLVRALGSRLDLVREKELDARANLEEIAAQCGVEARCEVRAGWTPAVVASTAEDVGADLVVVGAHRLRVSPSDELGNTCAAIVRGTPLPVLVWRPIRQEQNKTVLAAASLREASAPVEAVAARWAGYFGTRLYLMHAMPGILQTYVRAVSSPRKTEETMRHLEQQARTEVLAAVPEELREELEIQVAVVRGRPVVNLILAAAEAEAADLIVVGKYHAPGFTGRVLIGDVTRQVILGANCSVLTVPA